MINKEVNRLKKEKHAIHYVGIAADEPDRIKDEVYPLVEWGITETQALQICYDRGFDWDGLYELYHRCSCWCCPFQRINELRTNGPAGGCGAVKRVTEIMSVASIVYRNRKARG